MQDKMANMMQFSHERQIAQMPEMMLKMMMPHCIGMMLPAIDPDKRDEIAATILSAIVEKGTVGMSYEQIRAFHNTLDKVLKSST
jgi:hypothetical protein